MRIAYLSSRSAPHREPDVQQMLHTASGLRKQGIQVDLLLPRRWSQLGTRPAALKAKIGAHYGIRPEELPVRPVAPTLCLPAGLIDTLGFASDRLASRVDLWSTMLADAAAVAPSLVRLKGGRYEAAYSRRWPLAAAATHLRIPTFYETYTDLSGALLLRYARTSSLAGVVVHSECAARLLARQGFPPGLLFTCYNGYSPEQLEPRLEKSEARARLALPPDGRIVCYAGRTKQGKAPDVLIELAARTPQALYLVVGTSGSESRKLASLCQAHHVTNVRLFPWLPPTQALAYLYAADVLMIPPTVRPLQSGHTILPLKTFVYMATGRAIVAPRLPDLQEVLTDGRNAVLVPPDNLAAAAQQIQNLLGDEELQQRVADNARQDSAAFTWDARAARLAGFLTAMLGAGRGRQRPSS